MRALTFLLLIASFLSSFAQPAINKTYGAETGNVGYTVIPEQNGYLLVGGGYSETFNNPPNLWYAIKLYRVDSLGDTLWFKEYGKFQQAWLPSAIGGNAKKTSDGGYIIPGKIRDSLTGIYSGLLLRLNSIGDTIWTRNIIRNPFTLLNDCIETPDKGFAAIGVTEGFGDRNGDVFLIKLDSAGNTLWQKKYGGNKEDDGFSISLLSDGGFILGGLTYSYGPGTSNNYLIRTDSAGDTVWTRTYGIRNGANGGCNIYPSRNGGYIMSGLWDTISNNGVGGASYVAHLDTSGNIIWQTFFNDSISIDHFREIVNGDIVAVGQKDKPPGAGYFYGGEITKLDSNGSNLWEKLLVFGGPGIDSSSVPYVAGIFYDFQSTPDSGFVLTGIATYNTAVTTQINEIWLVKTDSTGCIDSYCGLTGVEEIKTAKQANELIVYPNPAQNTATIKWQPIENENVTIAVYDLLGNAINVYTANGSTGHTEINTSGFQNGLYFVRLSSSENTTVTTRLVIMK